MRENVKISKIDRKKRNKLKNIKFLLNKMKQFYLLEKCLKMKDECT